LRHLAPAEIAARTPALEADVVRLSRLATQLLTLGRTEGAAASAVATRCIDVAGLVADLAGTFDDRARARGVQLAFELEPLEVRGVEWMLREALSNLVDNAVAHAPAGTTVTLRSRAPRPGRPGAIEVEDRGPGVPVESRERAFMPFVRLAEDRPGSGLGLAIVRSIAERHGATAELDAGQDGVGTVARIAFG
jgi:two-component system sensor histidine kinase TctE